MKLRAVVFLLAAVAISFCGALLLIYLTYQGSARRAAPVSPAKVAKLPPTITPRPSRTPHHHEQSTEPATPTAALTNTSTPTRRARPPWLDPPARDLRKLATRLRGAETTPQSLPKPAAPLPRTGDRKTFWLSTEADWNFSAISATLRCSTAHLQMWVQDGVTVDAAALCRSAETFETRIRPTNRRYFGTEWTPGVDGDPRIVVLNARFAGVTGYYSSTDEYPRAVHPYSNQCEIIYLNLRYMTPGTAAYDATLAHEYQHMIHWAMDQNEEAWVNEGAAKLAERLNGFGVGSLEHFAQNPDVQLNTWPTADHTPHYAASYLFMEYFLARYGADAVRALVANEINGIAGFEETLRQSAHASLFDELFLDWLIANYLDDPALAEGQYGYIETDINVSLRASYHNYPIIISDTVHQYSAHYIELLPGTAPTLTIAFTGAMAVSITANHPHSGQYHWWSNRGDQSDMTLTRAFDLRGVSTATLQFALWYDIEEWWDWAYVVASSDGGRTWRTLVGQYTTAENPYGSNFGRGYTGTSRGWVNERIDLTPYAGHQILLRFEYVTDDAVNLQGLCIDDVAIPEIGYYDDVETDAADWDAAGFVRTTNVLPQRFGVQLLEFVAAEFGDAVNVRRLPLDGTNRGVWTVGWRTLERAVIIISGLTSGATASAPYQLSISAIER